MISDNMGNCFRKWCQISEAHGGRDTQPVWLYRAP